MTARRLGVLAALLSMVAASAVRAAEESGSREDKAAAERAGEAGISATDKGPTIEASELSKQPKLTKPAKVAYPPNAIGKSGEVEVVLLVDLDDKGEVTGATVIEPKTPTGFGFEEAAVTAAYSLGFEPAEVAGKPAPVQIVYKFKFVPPKPPAPPAAPVAAPVEAPKPPPVENLVGVLLERGTRLPMSGILVTVYRSGGEEPVGFENITDAKGHFHFFDLQPGTWKVFIEPPAYYPFRTTEEIRPGEVTHVTYYVERGSYNPFDKVVTAERERKEVSRTVIENVVIDKMPGAMGDPLAVIQNFAGVARAEAGSGAIIVRGSAPADTQIFVDGVTVPIIYHFGGIRSVLPVGMIDSLEFYPGNFSPYYGRATGGIVDVSIKKLKPKKAGGYFDVNLLDSGIYLEAPIGDKAAVAASIRRSYIDWIVNGVIPANAPITDLTLPRYYDYQVLANYRPAPAHDLRLFIFGSDDTFSVVLRNVARAGTSWPATKYRIPPASIGRSPPIATSRPTSSRTWSACRKAATRETLSSSSSLALHRGPRPYPRHRPLRMVEEAGADCGPGWHLLSVRASTCYRPMRLRRVRIRKCPASLTPTRPPFRGSTFSCRAHLSSWNCGR